LSPDGGGARRSSTRRLWLIAPALRTQPCRHPALIRVAERSRRHDPRRDGVHPFGKVAAEVAALAAAEASARSCRRNRVVEGAFVSWVPGIEEDAPADMSWRLTPIRVPT